MKSRLAVFALAATLVAPLAAAETLRPSDFAASLPLADVADGLNAVELTEAVYRAASHRSLADLRIFNANGEALPLAILPALPPPPPRVQEIDLTMVPLPAERAARDAALQAYALRFERDRARTVIEIRSDEPRAPTGDPVDVGGYLIDARSLKDMKGRLVLRFAQQADNFAGHAQVLGSDDLVHWRGVAAGPLAYERRLGEVVEKVRFELNRPPPFLRLAWSGRTAPQLAASRFEQVLTDARELPRARLAATAGEERGSLFIEVPRALPIERLFVRPAQLNESVRLSVYRHVDDSTPRARRLGVVPRRAPEHWVPVGTFDVFRVVRNGVEVQSEPLPFRFETDRIRMNAATALAVPLPLVEAEWRPHRVAFAARAPGPYRIAVGREGAPPGPSLDLAALLPADDAAGARLPTARIGADAPSPPIAGDERRAERIAARSHWSRMLLWALLLAGVLGLAAMAWRLAAQIRRPPAETNTR